MKIFPAVILAVVVVLGPVAADAIEHFHAILAPVEGRPSGGSGFASLRLDEASGEVTYEITFTGLDSPETDAHFHAPDGSLLHHLPLGSPKNGVWSGLGFLDLFQLREGQLFILLHTELTPAGELRGDIVPGRVGTKPGSVGALKDRYGDQPR